MQTKNITFHKTPPGKSAYLTKMTYSLFLRKLIPLHSLLLSFIIIQKIYDHRPIPVSAVYVKAGIFQPL